MQKTDLPEGELIIQTVAMPADTNANGDIFGGWLLSQMDIAGAVLARYKASSRVATVAIESMTFKHPVHIGDLLSCYGHMTRMGNTSVTIKIEAWSTNMNGDVIKKVTEGIFVYVAIDEDRRPRPIKKNIE
jgi:acyl-CoA thioesterase YciA